VTEIKIKNNKASGVHSVVRTQVLIPDRILIYDDYGIKIKY